MKNIVVRVRKDKLLEILHTNRKKHRAIFEEALEGYKKKVIELLEDSLKRARAGSRIKLYFDVVEPKDQTRDYDRVIGLLEMAEGETVELTEHDYACYVQDDWHWTRQFLASNSSYSGTAKAQFDAMEETEV